jgi:hypothetical protein
MRQGHDVLRMRQQFNRRLLAVKVVLEVNRFSLSVRIAQVLVVCSGASLVQTLKPVNLCARNLGSVCSRKSPVLCRRL